MRIFPWWRIDNLAGPAFRRAMAGHRRTAPMQLAPHAHTSLCRPCWSTARLCVPVQLPVQLLVQLCVSAGVRTYHAHRQHSASAHAYCRLLPPPTRTALMRESRLCAVDPGQTGELRRDDAAARPGAVAKKTRRSIGGRTPAPPPPQFAAVAPSHGSNMRCPALPRSVFLPRTASATVRLQLRGRRHGASPRWQSSLQKPHLVTTPIFYVNACKKLPRRLSRCQSRR